MLKLGFKKDEKVFVEIGGETVEIIVGGYKKCSYWLIFKAPLKVNIIRENAISKKSKERLNESKQI